RKGQPTRRIELGPAAPIEKALERWRQDIARDLNSEAAGRLRDLVWEKLAVHLAANTETVYLCPEGPLTALPWPALPGKKKGTALLEDLAIALVPHGPFRLERLREPARGNGPGALLALGGVAYDQAAVPLERKGAAPVAHAPAPAGRRLRWDP